MNVNGKMIYGLDSPKNSWLASQLHDFVEAGKRHIDGISIEPKGVDENLELVVEIHGNMNPTQLRLLADAIENTPKP
jgi:hypothetical protein